ncbi:MAG: hypothetical protein HKO56_03390 [Bacteroidia bacterium]|nr:hypothetical protein [Bacteroidia bacterium]
MIPGFITYFLIALISLGEGQFQQIKQIPVQADFFSTDHVGNVYVLENGVLTKYNPELVSKYTFSRKDRGQIEFIDTTDPLKLLVYYPEFGTIDFLNSDLADHSRLELNDFDIYQQTVVCRSHDNGLWVFDPVLRQLYKLDSELQISIRSQSFNQLFSEEIEPSYLNESEKWLVLADKENGLYVFDRLGVYLKNIRVKNVDNLQVFQDIIVYADDEQIHQHNIITGLDETLAIPGVEKEAVKQIRLEQNLLYMLTNTSLIIFKWTV